MSLNMPALPEVVAFLAATAVESVALKTLLPDLLPTSTLTSVFVRLFALQFGVYMVYRIVLWPRLVSPLRHLPRPEGTLPIIGDTRTMMGRPRGSGFLRWMKTVPNDGLICFRGALNSQRLLLTTPQALSEVLVTNSYDFEKPKGLRDFLRMGLGDGLIVVEGDVHRFQRKHVMPVFSFRHIKDLYPVFWDKASTLVQRVHQAVAESSSGVVEINHWANLVTMDIIGLAAMGRDFDALRNTNDPLVARYEEILEPTVQKQILFIGKIFVPALIRLLPWRLNWRLDQLFSELHQIGLQLVRDEKTRLQATGEARKDILALLLKSNNFSEDLLVDQLLTFLAAGHETTSSAFTWCTYLLIQHPDVLKDLRAEIHAHLPAPGQPVPPDFDLATTLESLPILNGVCSETLRLYPTVPVTVRIANKDTSILGQAVPKGTQVMLCPYAINRSPDQWGADAEEFRPERWIDRDAAGQGRPNASGGASSNYAILTFLHGPRSCIGQGFARAELRAIVAAFVGAFDFELADPSAKVEVGGTITTKPQGGMNLRLRYLGDW